MTKIVEKRESNSGKTIAIIEETEQGFTGTVTYHAADGSQDTDTREFTALPDAQGWLELSFIFMLGVHADS